MRQLLLTLFTITSISAAWSEEIADSTLIQNRFQQLYEFVSEEQYDECPPFFDSKTLAYFSELEQHALYDSEEEIIKLGPVDLLLALTLRAKIIESGFNIDSTEHVGLKALLKMGRDEMMIPTTLTNIQVVAPWAYATTVLGGKLTDDIKVFILEKDGWKMNLYSDLEQAKGNEAMIMAFYDNDKKKVMISTAEELGVSSAILFSPIIPKK